jgi:hypothetical protein
VPLSLIVPARRICGPMTDTGSGLQADLSVPMSGFESIRRPIHQEHPASARCSRTAGSLVADVPADVPADVLNRQVEGTLP